MKLSNLRKSAFTLVEVTLALSVASFCLLSVFGLVPVGLTSNLNAAQQTGATGIATALCADIHGTPVMGATTSRFQIPIPATGGAKVQHTVYFDQGGSRTGAVDVANAPSNARYRATITFQAEDQTAGTTVTPRNKLLQAAVQITWPALADPASAKGPANFSGSLDAPIALNCN
jgi:uncharacterized protein (TIGR02598 family)